MLKLAFMMCAMLFGTMQPGNKRLLYIYADKAQNRQLLQQEQLLQTDKAGLNERDISVKVILRSASPEAFTAKKITSPFTVILTGKDGGEKLRSHQPVTLAKLYGLVDAMPMRQAEMKHRP